MALSRVTPTGWLEETGTISRATPTGWVQETQAATGGAYTLTASHGTYYLAGQYVGITRNRELTASYGSYSYSGQAADVLKSKTIVAQNGSYSYSGQNVVVLKTNILTASSGSYNYSGQDVSISRNRNLVAQHGSYSYSGQNAIIAYTQAGGYTLTALHGSYIYSGQNIDLLKTKVIVAQNGSYSYSGQNVVLNKYGSGVHKVLLRTAQVSSNTPDASTAYDFSSSDVSLLAFSWDSRGLNTNDTVSYYADNGLGDWERGVGTWNNSSKTLTRTTIRESSTGSAIDWSGKVNAPTVWADGRHPEDNVDLPATAAFYLGDLITDGSWRIFRVDNDLEFQRLESGSWVKKGEIQA